jgi:tetratricopeptide (TPR) repeat protein
MTDLFVGRTTELDEFRRVLELASPSGRPSRRATLAPDEAHVVLVCGLGGIGKSTLLKRLREISTEADRSHSLVAEILDCEHEREHYPGDYAGPDGPPVWRLLDRLYAAVRAGAADRPRMAAKVDRAFAGFRQAMTLQPQLMQRAAALGLGAVFARRRLSEAEISSLSGLAGDTAQVAGLAVPGASALAQPVAQVAQTALSAAARRAGSRVGPAAYNALVTDLDVLVNAFADALRVLSHRAGLLVMFIDTGELLGGSLDWLRDAMRRSGRHVVWVLGLRLEAESDAGFESEFHRFQRGIHDARLRSILLTSFDDRTVQAFLELKLGSLYPDELDINAVVQLTGGVPLAVFLFGQLLANGKGLGEALQPVSGEGASQVIRELALRYLVHARTVPRLKEDIPLLYGLALMYGFEGDRSHSYGRGNDRSRPTQPDPDALAVVWGIGADQVAATLDRLSSRHDFVLSGERRLHQEVREAILLYLLSPMERLAVREINVRAAAYFRSCAVGLGHTTIDAQIQDPRWQGAVTRLLWHTFWASLDAGVQMLCQFACMAVTLDPAFAAALVRVAEFFAPVCRPEDQSLISAIGSLIPRRSTERPAEVYDTIAALTGCTPEPLLAASLSYTDYYDLLRVNWPRELGLTVPERADILVRVAKRVTSDGPTSRCIASAARNLAADIREPVESAADTKPKIISALGLITRLGSNRVFDHFILGNALCTLRWYPEAENAYREALRIDHEALVAYLGLANALHGQGRFGEVEAACRQALRLEPANEAIHAFLGHTLHHLGRFVEAEAALREALRLDPDSVFAHLDLADVLQDLGRFTEAEAAYRETLELQPNNARAYNGLGYLYLKIWGKAEDAEAALYEAVRYDPICIASHANLGSLWIALGNLDAARSSFSLAAQAAAPATHLFSELMLGVLDQVTGTVGERHFEAVLEALAPGHTTTTFLSNFRREEIQALALLGVGRAPEAAAAFSSVVSTRPPTDVFQAKDYELFAAALGAGVGVLLDIWREMIAKDRDAAGPWGSPPYAIRPASCSVSSPTRSLGSKHTGQAMPGWPGAIAGLELPAPSVL